jgi:hypothetical protein
MAVPFAGEIEDRLDVSSTSPSPAAPSLRNIFSASDVREKFR